MASTLNFMKKRLFITLPLKQPNHGKETQLNALLDCFQQAIQKSERLPVELRYKQTYKAGRELGLPAEYARAAGNMAARKERFAPGLGLGVKAYHLKQSEQGAWFLSLAGFSARDVIRLPLIVRPAQTPRLQQVHGDGWLYKADERWFLRLPLKNQPFNTSAKPSFIGLDLGVVRHIVMVSPDDTKFISGKKDRYLLQNSKKSVTWMEMRNRLLIDEVLAFVSQYERPVVVLENLGEKVLRYMDRDWAARHLFEQLQIHLHQAGIEVLLVDPRRTSRRCPHCAEINQRRSLGAIFTCKACGYQANVDYVAARNLAAAGPAVWQSGRSGAVPAQ